MSNNIFSNSNDKLNAVATMLLYVHRVKTIGGEIDKELIVDVLRLLKSKSPVVCDLKDIVLELLDSNNITKTALMDMVTLNMPEDSSIISKLKELINSELSDEEMKNYISIMNENIRRSTIVLKGVSAMNAASFNLNTKELSIEEQAEQLAALRIELDGIEMNKLTHSKGDDMESFTLEDDGILGALNNSETKSVKFKTGWTEFDRATAGGLARGELVVTEALQHKNKTGFTLGLFIQMILNNKIEGRDGKKPLFMWISLEDDLSQIVMKIFIYLYFREHKSMPSSEVSNSAYINKFIKEILFVRHGVEVVFKRIDPNKFSKEKLESMVENVYEAKGYDVVCVGVDYLEKAYAESNKYNTGATGSGLKNMFTVFRTYIQEKSILFLTPHQIAVDALNVLRGGVTDVEFLKLIRGKNFTQGSRGLPQEFDVEILLHLCKINGIDYQAVQIGKLKRPEYVNPLHKFMLIPFEKNVSIDKTSTMNGPLMESIASSNPIITEDTENDGEIDL